MKGQKREGWMHACIYCMDRWIGEKDERKKRGKINYKTEKFSFQIVSDDYLFNTPLEMRTSFGLKYL